MGDVLEENFHPEGCTKLRIYCQNVRICEIRIYSPNWNDMRSIADMNELNDIVLYV